MRLMTLPCLHCTNQSIKDNALQMSVFTFNHLVLFTEQS